MASNIQPSSVFCYSISHIYMAKDKLLLVSGIEAIGDGYSRIGLQWKESPKMGGLAILQRKLLTVGRISPMEIISPQLDLVEVHGVPQSLWKKETNFCWLSNEVNFFRWCSPPPTAGYVTIVVVVLAQWAITTSICTMFLSPMGNACHVIDHPT